MPWANGRGVSYEVARFNIESGEWLWRVAIAPIVEDGPFSVLNGVHRELTLLEGEGLVLTIDGNMVQCRRGQVVDFSGDAHTHAVLTHGPVVDLNVMSREEFERTMRVLSGPSTIDSFDCLVALDYSSVEYEGKLADLSPKDALIGIGSVVLRGGCLAVISPRR
jgi:environmental stress-induced protein Ves